MQSSYITSAQQAEQLPELGDPEIAFIGRSNCGKSSLLNALLQRVKLARASNTPGRTQMVNFFALDSGSTDKGKTARRLIFADLPGYGFAAIGKDVRHHWEGLVTAYLKRRQIRECLFLMDIRRAEQLEPDDLSLITQLTSRRPAAPVSIILTKADKVSKSSGAMTATKLRQTLAKSGLEVSRIVTVSALKKQGIDALRDEIIGPWLSNP